MKKIIFIFGVLWVLFNVGGCKTKDTVVTPYMIELTSAQKQEDLDYLFKTLSKSHKNLFFSTSKETFIEEKLKIESQIPTMTDPDFYHALQQFTALAKDGHTSAHLDNERVSQYSFQKALPFAVVKFDGVWRLLMADKDHEDFLGFEVLAVNDTPIEEVYHKSMSLISHETKAWVDSIFSNTINFIDTLSYLNIADNMDYVTLTLRDMEDREVSTDFYAMNEEEIFSAEILKFKTELPITSYENCYYRFLDLDEETFFLQYNRCGEDPDLPMKEFSAKVEEALKQKAYKTVIVDLRYNSGGDSSIMNPLTKILKIHTEEEDFSLFALIGTKTFSSGIINSLDLKNIGATLVGTPTGGAVNGYGELGFIHLPNMPVYVTYSTKYFELVPGYEGTSLIPDIFTEQSFEHYKNGIDNEVYQIMNP